MNLNIKTIGLLFFFFSSLQDYCCAQTKAGRFTLNASGNGNGVFVKEAAHPYGLMEAELGYVFINRFLGMANFRVETFDDRRLFRQRYSLRYSFLRMMPVEVYGGLSYSRSVESFKNKRSVEGQIIDFRDHFRITRVGVLFGSSYFLNENVAIGAYIELPIIKRKNFFDPFSLEPNSSTNLEGQLKLQFFFDPTVKSKIIRRDTGFSKRIMLGFSLKIAEDLEMDLTGFRRNSDIAINFGYILGKRVMIGMGSEISYVRLRHVARIGVRPFGRYYFLDLAKSKLYVEGQLFVNVFSFEEEQSVDTDQRIQHKFLDFHLGPGWSKKITKNLRLDLFTGFKLYQYYSEESKSNIDYKSGDRLLKIRIGLEQYF